MTPTEITALAELCDNAEADYADDWNAAIEAGERPDLWEPPEVEVPVSALRALLAEREAMRGALEPFIELAVATTVEGSPDYREWVGQSQDWMVALGFAGRTITLGQLRALAALTPPAPAPKEKPSDSYTTLRAANIARQHEWTSGEGVDLVWRANELAGEVGEACNVVKKIARERRGWVGSRATLDELAAEIADVVICADLLAMTEGIDLDAAVAAKFNATSEKVGLKTRLAAPPRLADHVTAEAIEHTATIKQASGAVFPPTSPDQEQGR